MRSLLVAVGLWWAGTCSAATVLIVGDSISAAYGIDKEQGWVALFERQYLGQCPGLKVNDGLRGLSPQAMESNLRRMVTLSREAGAKPLLFGMYLPPNYGESYRRLFEKAFERVAASERVPLLPFFLDGVGAVDGMMLDDGIHPNVAAQQRLLENARPFLEPALKKACQ
jgi:acyl-CoA thioesterase-1